MKLREKLFDEAFVRFLIVGATSTLAQFAILVVLVEFGGIDPVLASATGYAGSAALNYLLNRTFTFRSTATHASSAPRYIAMVVSALALNTALFNLLHGLGVNYIVCQVITTLVVVIYNYLVASKWVFASRAGQLEEKA